MPKAYDNPPNLYLELDHKGSVAPTLAFCPRKTSAGSVFEGVCSIHWESGSMHSGLTAGQAAGIINYLGRALGLGDLVEAVTAPAYRRIHVVE